MLLHVVPVVHVVYVVYIVRMRDFFNHRSILAQLIYQVKQKKDSLCQISESYNGCFKSSIDWRSCKDIYKRKTHTS